MRDPEHNKLSIVVYATTGAGLSEVRWRATRIIFWDLSLRLRGSVASDRVSGWIELLAQVAATGQIE
jgi:hypothetical protein